MAITYNVYRNGELYQSGVTALFLDIEGEEQGSSADWRVAASENGIESGWSLPLTVQLLGTVFQVTGSGGAIFGSTADLVLGKHQSGSGGIIVGGFAFITTTSGINVFEITGNGGTLIGGTALFDFVASFIMTPSGGMVVGSTSAIAVSRAIAALGGCVFGGTATVVGNNVVAPPATPTISITSGTALQVILDWADVSGATAYDVYRHTSTFTPPGAGTKVGSDLSVSTFTELTTAGGWFYRVIAKNSGGSSAASNEIDVTTAAAGGGDPTFRAAGSDIYSSPSYDGFIDVPMPAGVVSGDLLILAASPNIDTPAGWTQVAVNGGDKIFYKFAGPSNPTLTIVNSTDDYSEGFSIAGRIFAFQNMNTSTPFDAKDTNQVDKTTSTSWGGSVLTIASNSLLCAITQATSENHSSTTVNGISSGTSTTSSTTYKCNLVQGFEHSATYAPTIGFASYQSGKMWTFALKAP